MERRIWSWIDWTLLAAAVAALFLLPVLRGLVIARLLAHAVDPFQFADEALPWLTRLAITGYTTWAGVVLCAAALVGGLLVRARASVTAGRALFTLGVVATIAAASIEAVGVVAAWHADPTDFGVQGVGRCGCPEALRCIGGSCVCGCNLADEVAVQLVDADGDGHHEMRCVFEPPCGSEVCPRPVCQPVTSPR
ncbi:MAG: hypothetical protein ACOC1F_06220 [Myxococcota bacterium]